MDKEYLFYCRLLELSGHFTLDELKKAYRKCAEKYHPDLYTNAPAHEKRHAEEIMKQINEAYEYLKGTIGSARHNPNNSGSTVYGQSWTARLYGLLDFEYTALTKEQFDRDVRKKEATAECVQLEFTDRSKVEWGTVIKGTMPEFDGNYYITRDSLPKTHDGILNIAYGNTRTGELTLMFYPDNKLAAFAGPGKISGKRLISLRHEREEYVRQYNQLIGLINESSGEFKQKPQEKASESRYYRPKPYTYESKSHRSESKSIAPVLLITIFAIIFFGSILKGCPAQKEPNRPSPPRVEYALPRSEGGSITVKSDILTSHFGISYEQRQKSDLFMKDAYEYRYNGNGMWTITKRSAINNSNNNTNKNYINTNSKDEVENYLHGLGF